jgi:chromosome segregation ATPase
MKVKLFKAAPKIDMEERTIDSYANHIKLIIEKFAKEGLLKGHDEDVNSIYDAVVNIKSLAKFIRSDVEEPKTEIVELKQRIKTLENEKLEGDLELLEHEMDALKEKRDKEAKECQFLKCENGEYLHVCQFGLELREISNRFS